jgi:small-conductance mechanosensitive channel
MVIAIPKSLLKNHHMFIKLNPLLKTRLSIVIITIFTIWFSLLVPARISGQTSDVDPELMGSQQNIAAVKTDGKVLFKVSGSASFPAEQRAATISKRIEKAAKNPGISADSVKIVPDGDRLMIYAGDEFIMNIYDFDAAMEGVKPMILAEFISDRTAKAINSYRNERSRPVLLKNLLHAAGVAILMTIILFLILWLTKRLRLNLEKRIQTGVNSLEDKSFRLIRSKPLWAAFRVFFRTLKTIIIIVVIAATLQYILGLFPGTYRIADYVLGLFLDPLIKIGKGLLGFLPSLAFLIVIYFVTRYLLRLIKLLFAGIQEGGISIAGFDPEWSMPTFKILRLIVIVFALVVAFPYIPGSGTSAFKGISVLIGVMFSLGSSSFISNIIAGYSMTYRGAFKIGDRIQVGEVVGFVEEQKLMVTKLRSPKNEEIVIPNSTMLSSNIVNYSGKARATGLILHTTVGIGYETPWRQVDAMLKLAADRTEGLLKEPPPFVLKQSLGDFAVNYEINAYCNDATRIPHYYSMLHQNILDVFNENNVQIMTPAYEGDPEIPKVVPKDQWETPLASG